MHPLIGLIANHFLLMKISRAFGFDNGVHIVHDNQLCFISLESGRTLWKKAIVWNIYNKCQPSVVADIWWKNVINVSLSLGYKGFILCEWSSEAASHLARSNKWPHEAIMLDLKLVYCVFEQIQGYEGYAVVAVVKNSIGVWSLSAFLRAIYSSVPIMKASPSQLLHVKTDQHIDFFHSDISWKS